MKLKFITAVSAAALLMSTPAFALDSSAQTETVPKMEGAVRVDGAADTNAPSAVDTATENIKEGWQETKDTVKNAADRTGNAIEGTYRKIKAFMLDENPKIRPLNVTINENMTADGMIGKPVYNEDHERIATMHDIILDKEGVATMIVVKDGGFAGLGGKLAAFDYDAVINRTRDGDVVTALTQKSLDRVAEFSYKADAGGNVRVIPENGYSIAALMKGEMLGADGKKLAEIDNVTLKDGRADLVIASYGQILGMGGDKVAVNFNAGMLTHDKEEVNMKLSTAQTEKFKNFKNASKVKVGQAY